VKRSNGCEEMRLSSSLVCGYRMPVARPRSLCRNGSTFEKKPVVASDAREDGNRSS
jgi:hypothetical protein